VEQLGEAVGSVHENQAHFQRKIDSCDAALRLLTRQDPPPYEAIEALLLARHVAEQALAGRRLWLAPS